MTIPASAQFQFREYDMALSPRPSLRPRRTAAATPASSPDGHPPAFPRAATGTPAFRGAPASSGPPAPGGGWASGGALASGRGTSGAGARVVAVQRIGAVVVAAVLLGFGLLGFLDGLAYFSTEGGRIAGLSSNGLLSTVSVVTAAILVAAAIRGARTVSTVMLVLGVLFLLSAFANLAVLGTSANILAFSMSNVVFSLCAGLLLLVLGAYGRVSGNLPPDSPYRTTAMSPDDADLGPEPEQYAATPAERAAERDMRAAELAVAEHRATPDQARRVAAMARVRTRADRRQVWMQFDRPQAG
ncbi:MAG TPA: DUF4383 domain-containing protein [Streptomyces sp.]|nr:DUF4383 domain-containing protein [Streptomyces sp.]